MQAFLRRLVCTALAAFLIIAAGVGAEASWYHERIAELLAERETKEEAVTSPLPVNEGLAAELKRRITYFNWRYRLGYLEDSTETSRDAEPADDDRLATEPEADREPPPADPPTDGADEDRPKPPKESPEPDDAKPPADDPPADESESDESRQETEPTPEPPPVPADESDEPSADPDDQARLAAGERELLRMANDVRSKPFAVDARVQLAAERRAELLVDYFMEHRSLPSNHVIPGSGSPWDELRRVDANFRSAGENLAAARDVRRAHQLLMASSAHADNLQNPRWTHAGMAVRDLPDDGSFRGVVVVQIFIAR